jgi:hypothetical protein
MSRDRAESRIERLRRDKEQKEDAAAAKPGTERTTTPREDRERKPPR